MVAKYIIGIVGAAFLMLGIARVIRAGGRVGPAERAWLMVGAIFSLVAAWLWLR